MKNKNVCQKSKFMVKKWKILGQKSISLSKIKICGYKLKFLVPKQNFGQKINFVPKNLNLWWEI